MFVTKKEECIQSKCKISHEFVQMGKCLKSKTVCFGIRQIFSENS